MCTYPPPPPPSPGGVGKRCSPQGPVSSDVTKVQRAHQRAAVPCVLQTLSTPQDLPSARTPPASLALCAAPSVPLWVSQGAPQTTRPGYAPCAPRGFSHALEEGTRYPTHNLHQRPWSRAPLPRCWGPEHPPPPPQQHTIPLHPPAATAQTDSTSVRTRERPPTQTSGPGPEVKPGAPPTRSTDNAHRHGGISLPPAPRWGSGIVSILHGCETRQPDAQSRGKGGHALGPLPSAQAETQAPP